MQINFPLFRSHLDLAHHYWEELLQPGDWAIDATCGNGHDTLKLAQILQGGVIGIDIQEAAIAQTKDLLAAHLPQEVLLGVHLYHQSHSEFPPLAQQHPIRLIAYNLGYLPQADKQVTTMTQSTLVSVDKAMTLVMPGGVICITCYPGHEEGAREQVGLLEMSSTLPASTWNVCHHVFLNRLASPSVLLIQKRY